ncbi:N-acetylmuramoyl-L-alanine amidase [Paenibacillus mendelii]|uniref:N-acetylmuramoyl-L-alanine amidase n=1 Tax=Paenibacillus mendelii TaxID=206163 RepID=A0ABV6J5Q8_9BACL|nr:N-acetylmuramoyl-L-alanine amidase [Paenibacillus mendelii]MCQ6559354.1 N-acetylmuramoyl-L-alanine amidase [Paenibacillus mendelii]
MRYLVALDDGHGMETPGKRTPVFPAQSGLEGETKKGYMHENEFNRAVVAKCKAHLERSEIDVLLTAPGDDDPSLTDRTHLANSKGANLFVSVHANAFTGMWGSAKGVETYCYPGSKTGRAFAAVLHKHLIEHTYQVNRGVREADFAVLRRTNMPAALVEAAFMDNLEEATLLVSDAFRSECAEEIARGVCEFLCVEFVEEPIEKPAIQPTVHKVAIAVNGNLIEVSGFMREGNSFVPIRAIGDAAGTPVGWDQNCGKATLNSVVLKTTVIVGETGYAWAREVAAVLSYDIDWDGGTCTVNFKG